MKVTCSLGQDEDPSQTLSTHLAPRKMPAEFLTTAPA